MRRQLPLALILAAVAAAASAAPGGPPREILRLEDAQDQGFAGPRLGGASVFWARSTDRPTLFVFANNRVRRLATVPTFPVPPNMEKPGYSSSVVQQLFPAVSASTAAFVHSATLYQPPVCLPACRLPVYSIPLRAEVWAGPLKRPFKRLEGLPLKCPRKQAWADFLDVGGDAVIVRDHLSACDGRASRERMVLFVRHGRFFKRTRLARSHWNHIGLVAAAGRYVVWQQDQGRRRNPPRRLADTLRNPEIVVYDRNARRILYRRSIGPLHPLNIQALDVQADGTTAAIIERPNRTTGCGLDHRIFWTASRDPQLHLLQQGGATDGTIHLAGNRATFLSGRECWSGPRALFGRACAAGEPSLRLRCRLKTRTSARLTYTPIASHTPASRSWIRKVRDDVASRSTWRPFRRQSCRTRPSIPPATTTTWPVTCPEISSEASATTCRATSSGCATLRSGIVREIRCTRSSSM